MMWGISRGDGIRLQLLERHHAEALYSLTDRNRDHLRPWLPWVDRVHEVAHSLAFIEEGLERFARGLGYELGIWLEENLIGVIGAQISAEDASAAIGYWLDAGHQGRGIMTWAVAAVLDDLFFARGLHRAEIRVAPENRRSRAIPERLGFRVEGILREAGRYGGRWGDLILYAILEWEWHAFPNRES